MRPAPADEVGRRLNESLESFIESVVAAVVAEVPTYAAIARASQEAVRGPIARVVEMFLVCLVCDLDLRPEQVAALETHGAQRSRQGLPIDDVTAAVEVATRVGWRHLLARVDRLDVSLDVRHEAVSRMSVRAVTLVQQVVESLRRGYVRERKRRQGSGTASTYLVDRLIDKDWSDTDEIRMAARGIGLDLARGIVLCAFVPSLADPKSVETVTEALSTPGRQVALGTARSWPTPHGVAVIVTSDHADAIATRLASVACSTRTVIVVAEATKSELAIPTLYRNMSRDLPFAHAVRCGPGTVTRRELKFYRLLSGGDESDRVDFFQMVFGNLLKAVSENDAIALFDLLDTCFEGGTHKEVAEALHCTDRTVRSKLETVSKLTGLSWRRPSERIQLELAARLRHLAACAPSRYDVSTWGPKPAPKF